MTVEAGRLRHRVTIQQPVEDQDSETGAITIEWETLATVWASVEPLSAREFIAANAQQSKVTAKIVMRYRADVNAGMRITHKGRIYNIEGRLNDKDSGVEYMTLPCSEGVNQGD